MTDRLPSFDLSPQARSRWTRLQAALIATPPACSGDSRFVDDSVPTTVAADLRAICARCPVFNECNEFASRLNPYHAAGVWAGRRRGRVMRADHGRRKKAS